MEAFRCKMCGTCCYGEGGIFADREEIERVAGFLGLSPSSFADRYCRKKGGRFSIISGPDGFCIFFDREKMCLVHPVKPGICSLWPFYPAMVRDPENWKEAQDACPGINPECTHEDFVRQSMARTGKRELCKFHQILLPTTKNTKTHEKPTK